MRAKLREVAGLAAAQQEVTAAEGEYAAAFEKGDALAMAKANCKIANAQVRVWQSLQR